MIEKAPVSYCVISHTHWDREWYLPLEPMKQRLVALIDNLLKILDTQPTYIFHLDAQTIVLEDYLGVKPKNRAKITDYVRAGRLLIGPWYVQNDLYLSSGEATVRNLLFGTQDAKGFGECGVTGYCPDQFGNIAQLPQILKQFGINACVFGRGRNRSPVPTQEFYWASEDGSKVFCSYLTHWYNNAQRFSGDIDRSKKMLAYIAQNMKKTSAGNHYLLMNGVDHLEAQENLLPILNALEKQLPAGDRIYQGKLDIYMAELEQELKGQALALEVGEMREGSRGNVLAGTLSSRVYLKQDNDHCQMLLERQLEPLYTLLAAKGLREYPTDYLRYYWRLLLQNLAHDSICGCSVDAVNRHMHDRYASIMEGADWMLCSGMDTLQEYISRAGMEQGDYLLTLYNTVQGGRSPVIETKIDILEQEDLGSIVIKDANGNTPLYQIIDRTQKARGLLSPINLPGVINVISYKVQLLAMDLQGMGFTTYTVSPTKAPAPAFMLPKSAAPALENAYLRVVVQEDGTVSITQKASGITYSGLLSLEDTADLGDSYIFLPQEGDLPVCSTQGTTISTKWLQRDSLCHTLGLTITMALPRAYDFTTKRRTVETVPCILEFVLSLEKESRALAVTLSFTNLATEHRMRLKFPTGLQSDFSLSGNPFDCLCRNRVTAHGVHGVFDQPFSEFVAVEGNKGGIALFAKGLHEYEHGLDNAVYLSILRATGYITRDVSGEGPVEEKWCVPENQCLGTYSIQLAICPFTGNALETGIPQAAAAFCTPVLTGYQPYDPRKFTGGRPFVQGTDTPEFFYVPKAFPEKSLQQTEGFFTLQGEYLQLSAIKQAEDGDTMVLRLYNTSPKAATGSLCFSTTPKRVQQAMLTEQGGNVLALTNGSLSLSLKPKEIVTLLVYY